MPEQAMQATQCQGKDTFDTFDQATRVARSTRRKKHDAPITAYRCEHCGKFHIGSSTLGHKRKIRIIYKR